jgi:predicted nucleic-acid-binding Zn-ribbon protein
MRFTSRYNVPGSAERRVSRGVTLKGGRSVARAEDELASAFVCARCGHQGAHSERLALSGTGLSRLFEVQAYRYAFVSCTNCAYTEVYDLRTLEGKDDLGTFLEILFAD